MSLQYCLGHLMEIHLACLCNLAAELCNISNEPDKTVEDIRESVKRRMQYPNIFFVGDFVGGTHAGSDTRQ